MAIDDNIKDEKICDINREAAKISALSSGKIHKYEYLTGQEMPASDQSRMIEQVYLLSFTKNFWKQLKATEDEERKQNLITIN